MQIDFSPLSSSKVYAYDNTIEYFMDLLYFANLLITPIFGQLFMLMLSTVGCLLYQSVLQESCCDKFIY